MEIEIREFKPGEEKPFIEIRNGALKKYSWHKPLKMKDFKVFMAKKRQFKIFKVLFAVVNNEPIGTIVFFSEEGVVGLIDRYQPRVLPKFQGMRIERRLVEAIIDKAREMGLRKLRFSIVGTKKDIAFYVKLYTSLGFKTWRKGKTLEKSLKGAIPKCQAKVPLTILTLKELDLGVFTRYFVECFRDSSDRDAAEIALTIERASVFIRKLYAEEVRHFPELWMAAFYKEEFSAFIIASEQAEEGFIAEIGVKPKFRRMRIGCFLLAEALRRLKKLGYKTAFLSVDAENQSAMALYRKFGFKEKYEIVELEKSLE